MNFGEQKPKSKHTDQSREADGKLIHNSPRKRIPSSPSRYMCCWKNGSPLSLWGYVKLNTCVVGVYTTSYVTNTCDVGKTDLYSLYVGT